MSATSRLHPPSSRPLLTEVLPRHTFNLITGLAACACCTRAWSCDSWMLLLGVLGHLTTLCFHGAHCAGWERLADRVLMKYDVAIVITFGVSAIIKTTSDARLNVGLLLGATFALWLCTFGLLRGLRLYHSIPSRVSSTFLAA
jgi:hypothetical protein